MEKELIELLDTYVEEIKHRYRTLDAKQQKVEDELSAIKAECEQFSEKLFRAKSYQVKSKTCPICFVEHGLSSTFEPIPSDEDTDKFRCSHCGYLLESEM